MAYRSLILSSDILKAAKRVKPPFYLYDSRILRRRFTALRKALPAGWDLYFAVKANPNVAILRIFKGMGAKAECASIGEVEACLKGGFAPMDMAVSGPVKTDAELNFIKSTRPFVVHAESEDELKSLNALNVGVKVALRINMELGICDKKGALIMTGGNDKFGFEPSDVERIVRERGKYQNLDICGFHIYMGTQIRSARLWLRGAGRFIAFLERMCKSAGFRPSYVNLGGGLGIPYGRGASEFDLGYFKIHLARLAGKLAKSKNFSDTRFHIEPGRFLAGPAGVYIAQVVGIKKIRGQDYLLTNGGVHHALFPFRISREYPVRLLGKSGPRKRRKYILSGPLCTTLDQSEMPVTLPEARVGDIIAIDQSGAYGFSASMIFFLSHPAPAEVLWDGKRLSVIRRPFRSEHIFAGQD